MLRCNLVHFERDIILRNVTVCVMTLSRLVIFPIILLPIYLNDNNIFGEEAGHFGRGKLLPLKYPVDRTLTVQDILKRFITF